MKRVIEGLLFFMLLCKIFKAYVISDVSVPAYISNIEASIEEGRRRYKQSMH